MRLNKMRVYELLESKNPADKLAQVMQLIILLVILVSVSALILETVPTLQALGWSWFRYLEYISVAVFTIEYIARVWSSTASNLYSSRFQYMKSPMAIIDLAATIPSYLTFIPIDLRFLRFIRMLRIFRLAKLARYSDALEVLGRVAIAKRFELGVTFFIGLILLILSSGLLYFAENSAQPDKYSSIPATMWWAIATLTTVGYGDLYPITPFGKLIGSIVAITGIGMFALPTGILGAAFVNELSANKSINSPHRCPHCGYHLLESLENRKAS